MIVFVVAKILPRCGFSKVYELHHSCGIAEFLTFILSIQHPHTLRLENTIVQLSQNTCSCFNSCKKPNTAIDLIAHITLRKHEGHAMVLWYILIVKEIQIFIALHNNILKKWIT